MRKSIASRSRIEATIKAGQAAGLSPVSVSHLPDGTTVVTFGEGNATHNRQPKGWTI